jgi:hypothetical protein
MKNHINKIAITSAYVLISLAAFVLPSLAVAQKNDTVVVWTKYQPVISDANKINTYPSIRDTTFEKPQMKYSILNRVAPTSFAIEPIKAAKIGDATVPKLYRFLVKVGFGNYTTPYGELYYNNKQSKTYTIGTHIKHISSYGKIKDYAYPGFSTNLAEVYGKKYFTNHILSGAIGYERNALHYYGFKPSDYAVAPSKNDIKQRFSLIRADAHLNSLVNPDSLKLNYKVDIGYYNLSDRYGAGENNLLLGADVNKELGLIKITKSQVIGLGAKVDYYFRNDSVTKHNSGLITLNPYLRTKFKAFTFNLGLDATYESDTASKFHLYPIIDVQFNIVKDILILYGGVKGNMEANSYRSLSEENPFISGTAPMGYTNHSLTLFAGLRSNISRELSAHAYGSYDVVRNMPFFVIDSNSAYDNIFTLTYDKVNVFRLKGELTWQKSEKLYLRVGGDFWNYNMKSELKAWNKPYFDIFTSFRYNIASKIIVTADLYVYSDRWAKRYTGLSVAPLKLKGFVDGNLSLEYRYSKILGAFLNFNNIGASRYYKWQNYRAYGFNILGGISYSF